VVVVSLEDLADAGETQKDFPHLVVVADSQRQLISAVEVLHRGAGQHGEDTAAPTTIFVDSEGLVRSLFRPRQIVRRLSANEVLAAVDAELPRAR
jgi:hypothetical protein